MNWKSWLLLLCPLMAFAAPKKDLQLSYVVSTNDIEFYTNQPISFKISICDKKEQLCTEVGKTNPFTFTKKDRGLHLILPFILTHKAFKKVITKRRIFEDDAKIKLEMVYMTASNYAKFNQAIFLYKDLISQVPGDKILKDTVNLETGIVEVTHLLINY